MNVLLLASHAVAEYDDVRMFHDLGYDVFAPGGYEDPRDSGEGIRPPLPEVPFFADLAALCRVQRETYGEPGPAIDWAKGRLHPDLIDWADVIIVHHFPDRWIGGQWDAIKHKRVVWRTCGQSNPSLERYMTQFVDQGLEVVRYSPAEQRYFGEHGAFAGQHALIRFGKYPEDYGPWDGLGFDHHDGDTIGRLLDYEPRLFVGNLTQDLVNRGDACGYGFWQKATAGLPTLPSGKGSEVIGGTGSLSYPAMLGYLRSIRAFLYTGTRPASYTLGLIEAMLSGVPIISIGPHAWGDEWGGADLFEVASSDLRAMRSIVADDAHFERPEDANEALRWLLQYDDKAANVSRHTRARAIELFGMDTVGPQWKAFLG